jgi:hypothetical protein
MNFLPTLRRDINGQLVLRDTIEAARYPQPIHQRARPADAVENDAKQAVLKNNSDLQNRLHVLSQYTFQFSKSSGIGFMSSASTPFSSANPPE